MNQKLCEAISDRKIIAFYYDGGYRTVEPYAYGASGAGKEILRGYQLGGFSDSNAPEGWKLFHISRIKNLVVMEEKFSYNREDYNPADPAMQEIFCEVE